MRGLVFDIKEFAIYDGPGIRTTVFLKGCPLRCRWCHNPEGLSAAPQLMVSRAACTRCGKCAEHCAREICIVCGECVKYCPGGLRRIAGYYIEARELAEKLKKSAVFEGGGVTFSGGEPLMQWDFAREVIENLDGAHIAVETSGYSPDAVFSDMIKRVDLVIMDIKHADSGAHKYWTGVANAPILKHLDMLKSGDTPYIIRVPLIPGANDSVENLDATAKLLVGGKPPERVELLPYHQTAGAKYPMADMEYSPGFDTTAAPNKNAAPFTALGLNAIIL